MKHYRRNQLHIFINTAESQTDKIAANSISSTTPISYKRHYRIRNREPKINQNHSYNDISYHNAAKLSKPKTVLKMHTNNCLMNLSIANNKCKKTSFRVDYSNHNEFTKVRYYYNDWKLKNKLISHIEPIMCNNNYTRRCSSCMKELTRENYNCIDINVPSLLRNKIEIKRNCVKTPAKVFHYNSLPTDQSKKDFNEENFFELKFPDVYSRNRTDDYFNQNNPLKYMNTRSKIQLIHKRNNLINRNIIYTFAK